MPIPESKYYHSEPPPFSFSSTVAELDDSACWQHPFQPKTIRVMSDVVRNLVNAALTHSKKIPTCEIGGILWGEKISSDHSSTIRISQVTIVPNDRTLYNSTIGDFSALSAALHSPRQFGLKSIGFFRSHLREGLSLSEQDARFAERYLRDPDAIFLLLKPFEIGICMAGFFFWRAGCLQREYSELEVPFVTPDPPPDALQLKRFNTETDLHVDGHNLAISREAPPIASALENPSQVPPSDDPEFRKNPESVVNPTNNSAEEGIPDKPSQTDAIRSESIAATEKIVNRTGQKIPEHPVRRQNKELKKLIMVFVIAGVLGGSAYFAAWAWKNGLSAFRRPAQIAELGLKVTPDSAGQLSISWKPNLPETRGARHGKLTIIDGTSPREINLDTTELKLAKIGYVPAGSDIHLKLEVYLDNRRSIGESERILLPDVRKQKENDGAFLGAPTLRPNKQSSTASTKNYAMTNNSRKPISKVAAKFSPNALPAHQIVVAPQWRALDPGLPPNVRTDVNRDMPLIQSIFNSPKAPDHPPSISAGDSGTFHQKPPAAIPPQIALNAPSHSNAIQPSSGLSNPKLLSSYIAPQPIKEVLPVRNAFTSQKLYTPVEVGIQVRINESGRVIHVEPAGASPHKLLSEAAMRAAKDWVFKPARLHDKNVAADYLIVFRFSPTAQ